MLSYRYQIVYLYIAWVQYILFSLKKPNNTVNGFLGYNIKGDNSTKDNTITVKFEDNQSNKTVLRHIP